jgi:hypothetical protein
MPRQSFVFCPVRKELIPKDEYHAVDSNGRGPAVFGDNEVFVSPLDGKEYHGRAGMREHNKRHNVVSNRDLTGLPTYHAGSDVRSSQERRQYAEMRKELIINQVNKHYR